MKSASLPENESQRLAALQKFDILDTPPDPDFDALVRLASEICKTPISLVSLVDQDRQWFKARRGLNVTETPRDLAFCAHTVASAELFVVADTLLDERFMDHPLVTSDPGIRFYAGVPLNTAEGLTLGTLCVIDREPRELDDLQLLTLKILAGQVIKLLERRQAIEQLSQANDKLNGILIGVADDLRHPLGLVQSTVWSLRRGLGRGETAHPQMLNIVEKASQHAQTLLDELLDAAALEQGPLELEATDLAALVTRVTGAFVSETRKKQLSLNWRQPAEILRVNLNPSKLALALENLLFNALRFTPEGGSITVSLKRQGQQAWLSIEDTGVGISSELQGSVFDKFSRSRRHGTRGERTSGLAMYITHEIVRLHGGHIHLSSQVGKGSCFRIMLPLSSCLRDSANS